MQMQKRRLVPALGIVLAALIVTAGLPVFASGQTGSVGTEASATGPQYGGTLTARRDESEPVQADQTSTVGRGPAMIYSGPIMDYLLMTDYEKAGPRGDNVFPSTYPGIYLTPEQYWRGALAESWEAFEDKIVFNLRKGVMWQPNEKIGFKSRELVADDVVFALTRAWNSRPTAWTWDGGAIDEIVALDKYTVEVRLSRFDLEWVVWTSANPNTIYAPEVVEAGAGDWENQAGTGPFMFEEYVEGSYMKYKKYDNYWGSPTVIDGKEYKTPFVDHLIYPIVPDFSTRLAALRTGKLDVYYWMPVKNEQTLADTTPELHKFRYLSSTAHALALRSDTGITADKKVRQALAMALDTKAISDTVLLEAKNEGIYPMIEGSAGHIPPDKMDPKVRMFYEYHPDEAKKILAAEGYPDGFKLVGVVASSDSAGVAMMELAKNYWAAVGVDLEIQALDQMAVGTARRERKYDVIKSSGLQVGREVGTFNKHSINFAGGWNDAIWTDPAYYDPLFVEASATLDVTERNKKWAELAKIVADEVAYIPIGLEYELTYWWPWVKNYYGESSVTYRASSMVEAGIWIDQNLKKQMGY